MRAITSISAVIFLVSAKYNMATAYIVGLVENGEYGIAIAYSSVLILVMIAVIGGFQLLVGERRLRRRRDRGAEGGGATDRGGPGMTTARRGAVAFDGVRKDFGGFTAIPDLDLSDRAGRAGDAARPLGLRQDDDAADARGAGEPERGPHPDRRRRT